MTRTTCTAIIALCWVAGSLVGLLPLLGWNKGESELGCRFVEVMDYNYLVFLYFATIIFPALLLLASYTHIYLVVRRQIRQMASMNPTPRTKLRVLGAAQRREVKAAQNLAIIVFFFIVCWIPLYTINCIKAFCPSYMPPLPLTNFCIILSHLNSAVNPLLYAYHLRDFRAALRNLLCPCINVEEINDNTVYGRNSVASTNRVHHINVAAPDQQEHRLSWIPPSAPVPGDLNGGFRRRSLSTGDAPISSKETESTTAPSRSCTDTAASISRLVCEREVHSESSVSYVQPIQIRNRCRSAEANRKGLVNSGFEDDACTEPLVFASLPPIETELALQILTRPSSSSSMASHDALVLKDEPTVQIQRCNTLEAEGRA
ncbi:hypothetical protein B566_EDAN016993 [Ephemera danica]|nr:hypothetical protein B566_EDAN016993 [Ephemera danica]